MKGLTLAFFLILVLLLLGFIFSASGAQTNWPAAKAPDKALKPVVEVRGNRLLVDGGSKKAPREFRCMFDICGRSAKARADKNKKGAAK